MYKDIMTAFCRRLRFCLSWHRACGLYPGRLIINDYPCLRFAKQPWLYYPRSHKFSRRLLECRKGCIRHIYG